MAGRSPPGGWDRRVCGVLVPSSGHMEAHLHIPLGTHEFIIANEATWGW